MKKIKVLVLAVSTFFCLEAMQKGSSSNSDGNEQNARRLQELELENRRLQLENDNLRLRMQLAQVTASSSSSQASLSRVSQVPQAAMSQQDINRLAAAMVTMFKQQQGTPNLRSNTLVAYDEEDEDARGSGPILKELENSLRNSFPNDPAFKKGKGPSK